MEEWKNGVVGSATVPTCHPSSGRHGGLPYW